MNAEELADAMYDEVIKCAWADWALMDAENGYTKPLTETQQTLVESGMGAAYVNTLRALIRRGMLKSEAPE